MSSIKERIFGAVTVRSEEDAAKSLGSDSLHFCS